MDEFGATKGRKSTAAQLDKMWNESEQLALAEVTSSEANRADGRARRNTKVKVGDMWLTLH